MFEYIVEDPPLDKDADEFLKIISQHVENVADKRNKAIEDFFLEHVPGWQIRWMKIFPFLRRLFNYEFYFLACNRDVLYLCRNKKYLGSLDLTRFNI